MTNRYFPSRQKRVVKTVIFRKLNESGDVIRTTEQVLGVLFNEETGRFVVPVRVAEGVANVHVWKEGDKLIVDVHSEKRPNGK